MAGVGSHGGKRQEISVDELEALIARVEQAIEDELALTVEDMKRLLLAISTLSTVQQQLEDKDTTLYKLRKLLGMVTQSEQRHRRSSGKAATLGHQKPRANRTPRKKSPPMVVYHGFGERKKGDVCPACQRGKLYKFEPGSLLRITGHSPLEATRHITERLRCNACQEVLTAELPDEVLADGKPNQQYGYSARALMALYKFYSGLPYHHQGNLSEMLGVSLSASTIFDQCEAVANAIMPIVYELRRLAANASLLLLDDTPHRILTQQPEERPNRHGTGTRVRTGVYSSGLVAYTPAGQEVVLFETSLGHAGELVDSILEKRDGTLPMPIVMSDALSSNTPTVIETHSGYCNAHCRRQFYDLQDKKPEIIDGLLTHYGKIWEHERTVKQEQMDDQMRLAYHQRYSQPVMNELKRWAEQQVAETTFEAHSAFGKAVNYLLRHFEKLTLFCRLPGVPLDNNRMEETLKLVIRSRKTAHFFKTINGAGVANVLTSVIGTGMRAAINLFEYLTTLQRYHEPVRANPKDWLPWNYQQTLANLNRPETAAATRLPG